MSNLSLQFPPTPPLAGFDAPLVSVIIPTFNRSTMIPDALRSVVRQTMRDLEIIVVDDGSKDITEARVRYCFAESRMPSSRLLYVKTSHQGVSRARNEGVRRARGRWIAFLDSDDLWRPSKLARQLAYLEANPHCQIVYTDERWYQNAPSSTVKPWTDKRGGKIFSECLPRCTIPLSSVLISRALFDSVGGFDERLDVCEDYDLWLRIAARTEVGYIAEKLTIKRSGHGGQLSSKYRAMDRFRVRALSNLLWDQSLSAEDRTLALSELDRKCRVLSGGAAKRGRWLRAVYYQVLPLAARMRLLSRTCG